MSGLHGFACTCPVCSRARPTEPPRWVRWPLYVLIALPALLALLGWALVRWLGGWR